MAFLFNKTEVERSTRRLKCCIESDSSIYKADGMQVKAIELNEPSKGGIDSYKGGKKKRKQSNWRQTRKITSKIMQEGKTRETQNTHETKETKTGNKEM